ncbi:hypothetical protein E4U31_005228 [Claviceps sp. LM219 group G6]|nr:hypothetical protein E4U31_005228 [Claviceps sp. LM219 group G6]
MKPQSFLFCGALLCNSAAAFYIPYIRSSSPWQADAAATGSDRKPPSCLDGGNVTLFETSLESLPRKRSIHGSCGSYRGPVDRAYKDCAARARAGEKVARARDSVSSALIRGIFKDDSDQTRNHVAEHLAVIAVECEKNGAGLTPVSCGHCKETHLGLTTHVIRFHGGDRGTTTNNGTHHVRLCYAALPLDQNRCDKMVLGDVLLHEMSHSWAWTKDHGYGMGMIKDMSASFSLNNADSYTIFAKSAKLGCVVQGDRLVEGSSKDGKLGGVYSGNPSDEDNNGNGNNNGTGNGNGDDDDKQKGKPKSSASRQGGSGNKPTSSSKGSGGARSSSPSSPPHSTAEPPGGRQGGSGDVPNSSSQGRPPGESLGGEQDGDHSHTQDHDGPCPHRNTMAPLATPITTAIRPRQSTVMVTVTGPPTSTVIVTVTGPPTSTVIVIVTELRQSRDTTTPTPTPTTSAWQNPDQTLPE